MSGDCTEDVTIPVVFLFHAEGKQLLKMADEDSESLVYIGTKRVAGELGYPADVSLVGSKSVNAHLISSAEMEFEIKWSSYN